MLKKLAFAAVVIVWALPLLAGITDLMCWFLSVGRCTPVQWDVSPVGKAMVVIFWPILGVAVFFPMLEALEP